MANGSGKPRPAFFLAVLLVVAGLVGVAFYRFNAKKSDAPATGSGKIDTNRGKARVASDLSNEGMDKIHAEERMEKSMADDALKDLEIELGMRAPETTPVAAQVKDLGPAEEATEASSARKQPEKQTEKA